MKVSLNRRYELLDVDVDYVDNAEESDQCPAVSPGLQYEAFAGI